MKKTLILGSLVALCSITALRAQVTTDSVGGTIAAPVSAPPPVAPPPPPATTTTTTTTIAAPVAPVAPVAPAATVVSTTSTAPVYNAEPRARINVNRLRFGAFVAPNISWMKPTASTDDDKNFNTASNGSKLGFTYGLMADYFFAENYGLVTGISINSTGGKIQAKRINQAADTNRVHTADFDYRLQYLDIPLALKLRTDDINGFRFFAQLGVSVGFNISKKADYNVSFSNGMGKDSTASGTKIKLTGPVTNIAPVMFQMNIGIGAEYPFNNKLSAYAGIFFNNGFTPDATNPNEFDNSKLGYQGSFKDGNTRLNNFALRLGLFF